MKSMRLDDFVTVRARPVRSCPKPAVVLGYEPPFPELEKRLCGIATRMIHQYCHTSRFPCFGI